MTGIKASTRTAGTDLDPTLELLDLGPDPAEEWQRMLDFVRLDPSDRESMAQTVEPLFRRGQELVVQTYAYLSSVPETAAILGWETQVDEAHLEERRRFFTIWLARTLGMDTSEEYAYYLFRAGKFHAGHGPRKIHTPASYVTASIGMVLATFSHYLSEAGLSGEVIASGMAGWTKYLSVQLHLMLMGYQAAQTFDRGVYPVDISLFGRLRPLVGRAEILTQAEPGANVSTILHKFFNYYPETRQEALVREWRSAEKPDSRWVDVHPAFVLRPGWRILLMGAMWNI